jgi:hypothetical protein
MKFDMGNLSCLFTGQTWLVPGNNPVIPPYGRQVIMAHVMLILVFVLQM